MSRPLLTLALACFALACLAPIAVMLARLAPGDFAGLFDARTLHLLGRTALLGLCSTALALGLGLPFGFLIARTDVLGRSLWGPLGIVPLLLPPLMIAMTWSALSDLRGAPAAILFLGLGTFPIVALFVARAAERIDARLEEAALLAGGARARAQVALALVLPAALAGGAFAFVFSVNDFSVPDYVSAIGPKFNVYADEVFASWRTDQTPGRAIATSLPLVGMTLAALVPLSRYRRRGRSVALVGDFRPPERIALGAWRPLATLFCALAVALGAGVPLARLAWEAGGGPRGWSPENLRAAFGLALESRDKLANSLVYSAAAATLSVPLALILGHALARGARGRFFEPLFVLPIAVPAILFGIGTLTVWNHSATEDFYASGGVVVLLCIGRFLAFPVLVLSGAVAMLAPETEEAAALAGARPARRLARIVAPPLWPTLGGAWILVFVFSLRELDATIFVPAANFTAMFKLYNAVHFGRDDFVAALALLLVFFLVLPGLLWALFARRRIEVLP